MCLVPHTTCCAIRLGVWVQFSASHKGPKGPVELLCITPGPPRMGGGCKVPPWVKFRPTRVPVSRIPVAGGMLKVSSALSALSACLAFNSQGLVSYSISFLCSLRKQLFFPNKITFSS